MCDSERDCPSHMGSGGLDGGVEGGGCAESRSAGLHLVPIGSPRFDSVDPGSQSILGDTKQS